MIGLTTLWVGVERGMIGEETGTIGGGIGCLEGGKTLGDNVFSFGGEEATGLAIRSDDDGWGCRAMSKDDVKVDVDGTVSRCKSPDIELDVLAFSRRGSE